MSNHIPSRDFGRRVLAPLAAAGLAFGVILGASAAHNVGVGARDEPAADPQIAVQGSEEVPTVVVAPRDARAVKEFMLRQFVPDLPPSANSKSSSIVAFAYDDHNSRRQASHDAVNFESLNLLVGDTDPSRSWRLFVSTGSADLAGAGSECGTLMQNDIFLSCALSSLGELSVVRTVSSVPTDNLQLADNPPPAGQTQFDSAYVATSADGVVVAFHEIVDAPYGTNSDGLFVTPQSSVDSILANAELRSQVDH